MSGVIVGAYAASPALREWNPDAEAEYFAGLDAIGAIRGLELPWIGELHRDPEWLLANLPARFELVLTGVPWAVRSVAADPDYGLASLSEPGRRAALADAARVRDDIERLVEAGFRVLAVEVHSAPRADRGASGRLADSLAEIESWQWNGADLVVEHCDALVPGQVPQKGFLTLTDELAALEGTSVGVSLNWGRSAIELRDADAVVEHVRRARASGRLRGLILSGATASDGALGAAWEDSHAPFVETPEFRWGDPASVLTLGRAHDALAAAGDLDWFGFKFGWMREGGVDDRLAMIRATADLLTR